MTITEMIVEIVKAFKPDKNPKLALTALLLLLMTLVAVVHVLGSGALVVGAAVKAATVAKTKLNP